MSENFTPDPKIQEVAVALAGDAVDFAKSFSITLDWSDASIEHVETVLARLHDEMPSAEPSEEQILGFARGFGSYVGEVYRKNHGGNWGLVTLGDQSFPGMRSQTGTLFWPWARAENRIVGGPENNMWHYYLALTGRTKRIAVPEPPERKSWWQRLFER